MDEKIHSTSFLELLERMKTHLGAVGQLRRNMEERLKALLVSPVQAEGACTEAED